eukprot:1394988-Amorphochlora_amoeboformis.AAC.1
MDNDMRIAEDIRDLVLRSTCSSDHGLCLARNTVTCAHERLVISTVANARFVRERERERERKRESGRDSEGEEERERETDGSEREKCRGYEGVVHSDAKGR